MKLRFMKEESGMAMALAVIMIALLSVMGAGLLVFATTDLGIVIESNRGQRAFEMADAGVKAAQQQLNDGPEAENYDDPDTDGGNNQWAESEGGVTLADLDGNGDDTDTVQVTIQSLSSPANSFRVLSTGGYGDSRRVIEAVVQPTSEVNLPYAYYAGANSSCNSSSTIQADDTDIIIEGSATFNSSCNIDIDSGNIYVGGIGTFNSSANLSGSSIFVNDSATFTSSVNLGGSNGLYVRNDAAFNSSAAVDADRMYVGRDATFNSSAQVSNSSVYVGRDATFDSSSRLNATSLFSGRNVRLNSGSFSLGTANDSVYQKWAATADAFTYPNSFNSTPRDSQRTGIGAVGTISGSGVSTASRNTRSYDTNTSPKKFVGANPAPGQMTFPFDPAEYSTPLDDMQQTVDASKISDTDIAALRQIAEEQEAATGLDHFREVPNGTTTHNIDNTTLRRWPVASSAQYGYGTVVFVKFMGNNSNNKVGWSGNPGCNNTDRKGILVVENGNFESNSSSSGFNGWIIVRGTATSPGKFTSGSSSCMHAFVNATGGITADSSTEIYDPQEDVEQDLEAFRSTRVLSWRECYSTSCN